MGGDASEWVAAAAAIAAAGVVAWQSVETRRSALAAKEAAKAAVEGLEVARHSLDVATGALVVARDEESNSRELVAEAHRSRMDAAMPSATVIPGQSLVGFPLRAVGSSGRPLSWEECPMDGENAPEWYLPTHGKDLLAIGAQVRLYNGSAVPVPFHVQYAEYPTGRDVARTTVLSPGKGEWIRFMVWTTIEAWAAGGQQTQDFYDAWSYRLPIAVVWEDDRDSGMSVGWEFEVSGAPIFESHPDTKKGRYVFAMPDAPVDAGHLGPTPPSLQLRRENRSYWLSREDSIELGRPGAIRGSGGA